MKTLLKILTWIVCVIMFFVGLMLIVSKESTVTGYIILFIVFGVITVLLKGKKKPNNKQIEENMKVMAFEDSINNLDFDISKIERVMSDFILTKGEECLYSGEHEIFEQKEVTTGFGYAGPQARIKLAKGLYYKAGAVNFARSKETKNISKGKGTLNVTTKKIVFRSENKITNITLSSIIDIDVFMNAIAIHKKAGNPIIVESNNTPFLYNIIKSAVISFNN